MSTYPDNVLIKGDVINEVDVVDQNDHNILKGEIIALQSYIGTTPQGNRDNFISRFNAVNSGSGGFFTTNADPDGLLTYPGLYWNRTDLEALRSTRSDGVAQTIGGSFSNCVFSFALSSGAQTSGTVYGIVSGAGQLPTNTSAYYYWHTLSSVFGTIILSTFKKISGISTVTPNAYIWTQSGGSGACAFRVSIGSVVSSTVGSLNRSTPERVSFDMDVSGLDVGTYYDCVVEIRNIVTDQHAYMGSIIGIGS